jgi:hypothetical protein
MLESRTVVKVERLQPALAWAAALSQATLSTVSRVGAWAAGTAQEFGSSVATLMGPAVLSAYAFAAWSLTADMGWTDSFPFATGPLSNWMIWLGTAVALHMASHVLNRHQNRN